MRKVCLACAQDVVESSKQEKRWKIILILSRPQKTLTIIHLNAPERYQAQELSFPVSYAENLSHERITLEII